MVGGEFDSKPSRLEPLNGSDASDLQDELALLDYNPGQPSEHVILPPLCQDASAETADASSDNDESKDSTSSSNAGDMPISEDEQLSDDSTAMRFLRSKGDAHMGLLRLHSRDRSRSRSPFRRCIVTSFDEASNPHITN